MKLPDLLSHYSTQLLLEKELADQQGLDAPIDSSSARKAGKAGSLHLYAFTIPSASRILEDVPLTVVPPSDLEPTEGYALQRGQKEVFVQTEDSLGQSDFDNTLVPDTTGFFESASTRLADMAAKPQAFALGPAERLALWLDPQQTTESSQARKNIPAAVLGTLWHEDRAARWATLGKLGIDLMKKSKRVLLVAPTHKELDEFVGFMAKTFQSAGLPHHSLISCYEVPVLTKASGTSLKDLSFEAQMHSFFAHSHANKNVLRKKYDRFRELIPILSHKGQKQRDLNEVKLLEWRLLAQVSEFQGKIKDIDKTVAEYENLPIWKRLGMQTLGKNVETLGEYREIYTKQIKGLMKEVEIAQARIRELIPEATVPKHMQPEYEELKEEVTRLGGTKKIREMLAAGEGTNRQAFIQNKRLVACTPGRILIDPLFTRVRFDVLIADGAPAIPAPVLLGVAGVIREQIILSGNIQDLATTEGTSDPTSGLWRQHVLDPSPQPAPSSAS